MLCQTQKYAQRRGQNKFVLLQLFSWLQVYLCMQSRLPEILSLEYSRAPALLTKKQLLPSCHVKFVHVLVDRQMI